MLFFISFSLTTQSTRLLDLTIFSTILTVIISCVCLKSLSYGPLHFILHRADAKEPDTHCQSCPDLMLINMFKLYLVITTKS